MTNYSDPTVWAIIAILAVAATLVLVMLGLTIRRFKRGRRLKQKAASNAHAVDVLVRKGELVLKTPQHHFHYLIHMTRGEIFPTVWLYVKAAKGRTHITLRYNSLGQLFHRRSIEYNFRAISDAGYDVTKEFTETRPDLIDIPKASSHHLLESAPE